MIDQQIKNELPRCTKCGVEWKPVKLGGVPLLYYHTELVCGECLIKIQRKMSKWIQEMKI